MSIDSIQALQECMSFLGLRLDRPSHEPVYCLLKKQGGSSGTRLVTFQNNVHAHAGPYLTFDEAIRGFGIPCQVFKPHNDKFDFNEDCRALTCEGNGYKFHLTF